MKEYKVWVRVALEECDDENDIYRDVCVENGVIEETACSDEFCVFRSYDAQEAQDYINSMEVHDALLR
jgi:hypothetical protein